MKQTDYMKLDKKEKEDLTALRIMKNKLQRAKKKKLITTASNNYGNIGQ